MYEFRNVGHNKLIVAFIFTILSLKICNAARLNKEWHENNSRSENFKTSDNKILKNYYQHEPYGPQTYAFGFEVNDKETGNRQFRDERRLNNGTIEGSYGYVSPNGNIIVTNFIADSKIGYKSYTRTLEKTSENNDQIDWHAEFWPNNIADIFLPQNIENKSDQHNEIPLLTPQNIDVNHMDLTKDLLNSSVWDIVSGKLPLKKIQLKDNEKKQLGFETFEKVIPKEFPIVPFELPKKLNTDDMNNSNETILEEMPEPKPLLRNETENDWISKVVNETRNEFLENLPKLPEIAIRY